DAASVASKTLEETQRSNNRQAELSELARKSSEAATKIALQATIDNFHQDQRAWVSIKNVTLTKPFSLTEKAQVRVLIGNSGKTPALKQHIVCRGLKIDAEPVCDYNLTAVEKATDSIAPSGEDETFLAIDPQSQTVVDAVRNKTH